MNYICNKKGEKRFYALVRIGTQVNAIDATNNHSLNCTSPDQSANIFVRRINAARGYPDTLLGEAVHEGD